MAGLFEEVIDAGPGWTKVRTSDGDIVTVEGARNWRNNNPGNLEYGPFAKSHGAIGTDGRFAVFPSYDIGRDAKSDLIFDSPSYSGLSLTDAIYRYAPAFENPTNSYINHIAAAAGVSPDTTMSSIPANKRAALLDAMQDFEGWKVGTMNGAPAPAMAYTAGLGLNVNPALQAIGAATGGKRAMDILGTGGIPTKPTAKLPALAAPNAGGGIFDGLLSAYTNAQNAVQSVIPSIKNAMASTVAGRTAVIDPMIKNIFNGPKKANVGSGGYDRTTGTWGTTLSGGSGMSWNDGSSGPVQFDEFGRATARRT